MSIILQAVVSEGTQTPSVHLTQCERTGLGGLCSRDLAASGLMQSSVESVDCLLIDPPSLQCLHWLISKRMWVWLAIVIN